MPLKMGHSGAFAPLTEESTMTAIVTKLPMALSKEELATQVVPQGHHIVTLNYNMSTKGQRESEHWIAPKISAEVLSDSDVILAGIQKFVDSLQVAALREYTDGDLEYLPMVSDVKLLFENYITDRRGERKGPKQSQLVEWIKDVLMPYVSARIERNLPTASKESRQNLIVSFATKFGIAATRSNRRGNETLPEATLKDLQSRLVSYSEDTGNPLLQSIERDAIIARITDHISVLQKANAEITTEQF